MPKRSASVSKPSHFWFNRRYREPSASLQLQLLKHKHGYFVRFNVSVSVLMFNIILFHFISATTLSAVHQFEPAF